jgi:hypothetical protein
MTASMLLDMECGGPIEADQIIIDLLHQGSIFAPFLQPLKC